MTIKIPLPPTKSPFHLRRTKLGAIYVGPGYTLSGRGSHLGAFYDPRQTYPLPAPSVFRGLGAFFANVARPPLPAANVFRGMHCLRGMGQSAGATIYPVDLSPQMAGSLPNPYSNPIAVMAPASDVALTPPTFTTPSAPGGPTGSYPVRGATLPPVASTNPALDAFNQALTNSGGAASLTPDQLGQLSAAVGAATPAQLTQLTSAISSTPPTSISSALTNWLAGTTSLGGYTIGNSTLIFGGGALAVGLVLLSSLSGGKKKRRGLI
ncbi:MAG: hypothetical protein WB780_20380 [Candidatus Acidiferrales bacterium]